MKRLNRWFALCLSLIYILCIFTSCKTQDDKQHDRVYAHLSEKYPGNEFQINTHIQETETSGKHTFNVTCLTTGVDFEVIMTSLFISDSFYVEHGNEELRKDIFAIFGTSKDLLCLEDVQCFDPYLTGSGTYRFKEDEELMYIGLSSLTSIHCVTLTGVSSASEAAQCIYMFCDLLKLKGVVLEKINFEFTLNKESVRVVTDTYSMSSSSIKPLIARLEQKEATNSSGGTNFFYNTDGDSNVKIVPYFVTD